MSDKNAYFTNGIANEQSLIEDLIIESISIYGQQFYYIPRTLVAKDDILGEDRLSRFTSLYPITMYLESVDGFEGQGAFIQKFGMMLEQSATLTVSRRRWTQLVGNFGQTQLPNRPSEGDLLYFPLTKGLFEIKFVQHQDPFYQLGKLYVYKLQIELYQYASERIDTGNADIDAFETLKTFDTNFSRNSTGAVTSVTITNPGSGYTSVPTVTAIGGGGTALWTQASFVAEIKNGSISKIKITNTGTGYDSAPQLQISNPPTGGTTATATAFIEVSPDIPQSYGDNIKFKAEATDVVFNVNNPFGDIQ